MRDPFPTPQLVFSNTVVGRVGHLVLDFAGCPGGIFDMHALGEELSKRRPADSRPAFLDGLGPVEKIPAALAFGAILGLSSPGFDIWWLAWIGLVPLLVLARSCNSFLTSGMVGFAFGFAYHLVCHRWILGLYPLTTFQVHDSVGALAVWSAWFIESAHQALLIAIFSGFASVLPSRAGILPHFRRPFFSFAVAVPIMWVFLQWTVGTSEPFLGVPVNQLAYSQAMILPMMQVCSLAGCQLLEFLIVLLNASLAVAIFELLPAVVSRLPDRVDRLNPKGGAIFDVAVALLVVSVAFGWGEWRLRKLTEFPPYLAIPNDKVFAPPVPVAVLQGDIPVRPAALEAFSKNERVDKYINLAQGLGVAMFVLPEAVLRLQDAEGKALFSRVAGICAYEKKEAILGSFELLKSSLVNCVRMISGGSAETLYVKTRLLPFVESIPFNNFLNVIPENLFSLLPSARNNFFVSPTPYLLRSVWGNVGASVSFELVYPELIAQEVHNGAALLVNVSDLSWFHDKVLSKQLLAAAITRAVENGRYLVLASNTGISAVVNPLGVVTSNSVTGQSGNLVDRVQFLSAHTHFTRNWWLWRPSYRIWWH